MHIHKLLQETVKRGASDLHISVGVPPALRIDGSLVTLKTRSLNEDETIALANQLLTKEKKEAFEELGEVDFSYSADGLGIFRVNVYMQRGSTGIAVRSINTTIPTLEELELPQVIASMALYNRGLVLVTGPTGSGKSTTMAAMINLINTNKKVHIITLEEPIEYIHPYKKSIITQREIGRDSRSYAGGLRAALRQDPDVILVGEMRDLETMSTAITAAETGHLVMATLHTIDTAQSVERIIDSFPSNQQQQIRIQLANSLVGVISQRLIPRSSKQGRIVAAEILLCNYAVRTLIREGKVHQIPSLIQLSTKQKMQTMDKHLQELYAAEKITKEDVFAYCRDKPAMEHFMKSITKAK